MSDTDEELVKIHIDLTGNADSGGEAMWAKALGGDLYEVRNIPFHAYGLNWLDVVRAVELHPNQKPSITEVVRRSGHRTIWLTFAGSTPPSDRRALAAQLNVWKAYYENADGRYFAVDVEPDGQYDAVIKHIETWRLAGVLEQYRIGPLSSDVRKA